ncbi:MAG TPA: SprT-like domain-containing protein [Gemmatimonadales bacterium]|nr:SprT-like domain-containing protein [Gemmatimonadales bacterium]
MSGAGKRGSGEAGKEPHLLLGNRLGILGLRDVDRVLTHTNRTVMLSLHKRVLRVHRGYAFAPDRVLQAIVRFLNPRVPRALRRLAEREFLAFPVEAHAPSTPCAKRPERARPGDLSLLHRLESLHRQLNAQHFGGTLAEIPIRLSSRMRTRLGELAVEIRSGEPIDIAISRRHIARHAWCEVEHTLLHEMVHQWQAETGLGIDHGRTFRRKAREVGVLPAARRRVGGEAGKRGSDEASSAELCRSCVGGRHMLIPLNGRA